MKKKMEIGLRIVFRVVFVLFILLILDIAFIYLIDRPIFAIKKDNVYRGILFNVYDCGDDLGPQVKFKSNKFTCSEVDLTDYRLTVTTSDTCDETLKLYLDGKRKIYLSCVDDVFVVGNGNNENLKEFVGKDVDRLDKILDNYEGQVYNDGGSISYVIKYRGVVFRVDRCNYLGGNYDIYIGNKDMKFMCNRDGN